MHKKSFFIKDILTRPNSNESLSLINIDHQTSRSHHPKVDLNSFNLSPSVYSSVSLWPSFNTVSCISCIHSISSSNSSVNWSTGKFNYFVFFGNKKNNYNVVVIIVPMFAILQKVIICNQLPVCIFCWLVLKLNFHLTKLKSINVCLLI